MKTERRKEGDAGEDLAVEYLKRHGFKILERNFNTCCGEIDIVAKEKKEYVFVEVKARRSNLYGPPEEAVTPEKERHIRSAAEVYCAKHSLEDRPCRFDVIAIEGEGDEREIRHLRNVF
jgi:putative endonuclease